MEESKSSAVKKTQGGDDSGYSCTSTQSKYSQSASSGDSCFEERRSSTLTTTDDRKMSAVSSESTEQPNQTQLRNVSGLETTNDQESNNTSSKSKQTILPTSELQMDQLYNIDVSEIKQSPSTSKTEYGQSKNINTEEGLDQKTTDFPNLNTLCQSYSEHKNVNNLTSNSNDECIISELNNQEAQLKEIIESDEVHNDSFDVVVSMNNGLIINTSNSIHKNMGYPKYMWQGRSFIDYIHPNDRISFTSYVKSVLTDPYTISRRDGISTVTFLRSKKSDEFYCNMRRYKGLLNTGYSVSPSKNVYQVCKMTMTFKDFSYASTSSCLTQIIKMPQSQLLLIVNAQLIHSVYKFPEEKIENPIYFITKHNESFQWCYVDHLIISHFGYLPQNIIGRSIFDYYNIDDLTTIKQFHETMTKSSCVSHIGKPYQFRCQNGNFALVQTEWSNFVNPWSGRVEFVTGRHKVIQGPINPDVTTPIDDDTSHLKMTEAIKIPNYVFGDINKILQKNIFEVDDSNKINQTMGLNTSVNQQMSTKSTNLALCMNCLDPLEIKVQPEMYSSFSDHDSVMLGEISPHHNYESKSGSETPPSYTQLNYNDNIQRFFNSNLKLNSPEELSEQVYLRENITREVTPPELAIDNVQKETIPLLQSVTPCSSMIANTNSMSSEKKLKNNCQTPLTQKMLLRHNKKMEDDLVKEHKNKSKKNKCKEKSIVSEENINISDIARGVKRSNSIAYENNSCKLTKKKHLKNNNSTNASESHEIENILAIPTVARATQIWSPCQITRDSQTTEDLASQKQFNIIPLTNNVMPAVKHDKYKNMCSLMDLCEQKPESIASQLQPSTMPFYASEIPDHVPQNSQILQPCLYYNNQLLLQPYKNIDYANNIDSQNQTLAPIISKIYHQVNQEGFTSSDSDCRREIGSLQSSSKWLYENSSFYSSTLREKTDSSEKEDDYSWPTKHKKTEFADQPIKKQPFWMENIEQTPDLIFRYQIEHGDINEILKNDMKKLNTFSQPLLVSDQFRLLYEDIDVNGTPKNGCPNDESSASCGEECLISIGKNNKKKVDFSKMAMFYEENAALPQSTT